MNGNFLLPMLGGVLAPLILGRGGARIAALVDPVFATQADRTRQAKSERLRGIIQRTLP